MAYSGSNPARRLLSMGFAGAALGGDNWYIYMSSHASTDITAANFFTGCAFGSVSSNCIGMSTGDILINVNTQTNAVTLHLVSSVSTSTGAANTSQQCSALSATVSAGSS